MRNRTKALIGLVAALSLVAAACGDDDDTADGSSAEPTEAEASAPAEEGASEDEAGDIVATAEAAGDFSTLVAAVEAAGLTETLQGEGPYTVLAPTDAAFEALPEGTLDELLADPEALADVLTYHVLEGEVPAEDVVGLDGQAVPTVNGAEVTITVEGETVRVNDATVTMTDVQASNGIIHVIDAVLIPPAS